VELSARIVSLELADTFTIARSSQDTADVVEVEIRHDGVSGFGEAAPLDIYDESTGSALAYLEGVAGELGGDPFALEEVMQRLPEQFAARAAIDAALHDLCGKLVGEPVWRLLGLERAGPPTAWTISLADPDAMARKAEEADAPGRFKRLKLKLGGRDGLDVDRVRAVRGVTNVPLQVDVNEYWTHDEALESLPQLDELGVEYCEQPLRRGDEDGVKLIAASPIPIFVDEDCHTLDDVAACAKFAHGINIKLAKSGGIREAMRMVHAARALRMGVMLGCMLESGLGIAAGAAIASLCDYVDLDGNLLIAHDPWPGVELVDGVQTPSEEPGLGVRQAVPSSR
jgi:L-alanine-DL-glutamate epimerase-like enolase superfamily enzyme